MGGGGWWVVGVGNLRESNPREFNEAKVNQVTVMIAFCRFRPPTVYEPDLMCLQSAYGDSD